MLTSYLQILKSCENCFICSYFTKKVSHVVHMSNLCCGYIHTMHSVLRTIWCARGYVIGSDCLTFCLSVCDKKKFGKKLSNVYTSSKHIEKLKISSRRTSAYLGVANAVRCIKNWSAVLLSV